MRRILQALLALALITGVGMTPLMADVAKGQKIYLKKYKAKFGMNGTQFASLYSIDEWQEMFEDKGALFIETFGTKYPNAAKMLESDKAWKDLEHIRDFAIQYANDSGNVPSCG